MEVVEMEGQRARASVFTGRETSRCLLRKEEIGFHSMASFGIAPPLTELFGWPHHRLGLVSQACKVVAASRSLYGSSTTQDFNEHFADVVGSAIGFTVFAAILSSWALTFSIGGERLFGHVWDDLLMYNVAERFGLTGWI
ncbi:hypothetical protein RHSIM_Rhsim10G0133300 [Rhododendron simsii]|uniref:Uncharacterized protein n=1 Tax=Rhododendron simsii TaxID=118357 RepID=A0A834GD46_RHOSS|nr:hypothetical protein RHSIM_Rhsim10G0133300 [Rhododendron simsii]